MTRGKPLRLDGYITPVGLYFALESTWKIAWLAKRLISLWEQRVKKGFRSDMNDGAVREVTVAGGGATYLRWTAVGRPGKYHRIKAPPRHE